MKGRPRYEDNPKAVLKKGNVVASFKCYEGVD